MATKTGKAQRKFDISFGEFRKGTLRRRGGKKVVRKDVALAIAFSEARRVSPGFRKKRKKKK